ncbi:MAG: penicillin-binding protein activator [Candidatus Zixiibacteriota bacterium]
MRGNSLKYSVLLILLLMLLWPAALVADDAGILFKKGFDLLQKGDYDASYSQFAELVNSFPEHQNRAKFLFFKGKAGYYAGRYEMSLYDLRRLINDYPNTEYISFAYLFLGNNNFRLSHPDEAINNYIESYRYSRESHLDGLLLNSIEKAIPFGRAGFVEKVRNINLPADRRCRLLTAVARGLINKGSLQSVPALLASCPGAEATELITQANTLLKRQANIGVVLPLSGEMQKYGEQLLDGIKLRAGEYGESTGRQLKPIVYDSRGEAVEAARIVKQMADEGITAAIGPLTSDETSVSSAVLACADMPLIVPAATEGGLTKLSKSSFQLPPNIDWQGIRMADLAVKLLGADTAAIITPTSSENMRMARAFAERFKKLGGTILGIEYFRPKETDFGPYIRDLKSLAVKALLDSITFMNENGDTIEAEEVPVWLDCIYIPADAGQLRQLLPQINFYNLNTVYLGGDGWGNSTVYALGAAITKRCYFASGLIEDAHNTEMQAFAADFDRHYGRQPGRLEALGYDAMSLVCEALKSGKYSHSEITGYLSGIRNYPGASGKITFGNDRENIALPVYKIEDGLPHRVEPDSIPK